MPDRAPAMVDTNSNLDLLERPEGDGSHPAPVGRSVKTTRRRMRPAGNSGRHDGGDNEKTRRTASVSRGGGIIPGTGAGTEITIGTEDQVQQNRRSCSVGSRGALPTESGGGGGVTFTVVAEVHVSAAVNEEDKFIAQASGQHVVCDTYLGEVPAILNAPPGDTLVNQPEMYSAQKIDLDGMPMEEVVVVLEPLEFSAPDASLDSRPIAGNMDWNPSYYVVHNDEQTRRV